MTEVKKVSAEEVAQGKNNSIEESPVKNLLRIHLAHHVWLPCIQYMKKDMPIVISLPAEKSYFENILVQALEKSKNLSRVVPKFYCVEMDKYIVPTAFKNMPDNATMIPYCTLEEFLKYETIQIKPHVEVITPVERKIPFFCDLGWFDYCAIPNIQNVTHFIDYLNQMKQGCLAVTFDLSVRKESADKFARHFSGYKKGLSLKDTIIRTIEKGTRGKSIRLVYVGNYGGGDSERTNMLTLAYTVNIPKYVVKAVFENLKTDRKKLKTSRVATYYFLKHIKDTKHFRTDTLGKKQIENKKPVKKIKTPEEKRADNAVTKWAPRWKDLTMKRKIKIATRYGKTLHQFKSMVACRHGKHAIKRALRIQQAEELKQAA